MATFSRSVDYDSVKRWLRYSISSVAGGMDDGNLDYSEIAELHVLTVELLDMLNSAIIELDGGHDESND